MYVMNDAWLACNSALSWSYIHMATHYVTDDVQQDDNGLLFIHKPIVDLFAAVYSLSLFTPKMINKIVFLIFVYTQDQCFDKRGSDPVNR